MLAFVKRRDWTLLVLGAITTALVAFNLAMYAYAFGVFHFGPSPEEARAALAEADWCKVDSPINKRDETLFIGEIECDLRTNDFHWGVRIPDRRGEFVREHGRWIAKPQRAGRSIYPAW